MPETFTPTPAAPPATWELPNNLELADAEALKTNVLKKEANSLAYFEQQRLVLVADIAATNAALATTNSTIAVVGAEVQAIRIGYRNQRPTVRIVGTAIIIGTFAGYFPTYGAILSSSGTSYTLGGLANTTWYYVYATQAAGVINAFTTSTTAPDATLQHKTGDVDSIYLCCFRTDSFATPYAVRSVGGRYLYEDRLVVLTSGNSAVYATVSLASYVPPHAWSARLWGRLFDTSVSATTAAIRPKYAAGSSSSSGSMLIDVVAAAGINTAYNTYESEVGIEQGQGVEYKVTGGAGFGLLDLSVTGFGEAV